MENILNNSANLSNVSLDQPEKPVTINNNDDKRDILKFSRQKFLASLHNGEVPRGNYASQFIGQMGIGESKYDVGFRAYDYTGITPADVNRYRAMNQPKWDQVGNAIVLSANELTVGTLKGISELFIRPFKIS